MDLIQWLLSISENVLQTIAQIEQLAQGTKQSSIRLIPILEQNQLNLNHTLAINSTKILFTAYVLVCFCIKKPQLLSAFFMSCLLFECSFFDSFSEGQLYLITFIIYSYVMFCNGFNADTRAACVIMCLLCVVLAYDAAFYGVEGFYGAYETVVYNHIEHLVICCHILIIYSTIKIGAIRNNIRNIFNSIVRMSRRSVNFTIV